MAGALTFVIIFQVQYSVGFFQVQGHIEIATGSIASARSNLLEALVRTVEMTFESEHFRDVDRDDLEKIFYFNFPQNYRYRSC